MPPRPSKTIGSRNVLKLPEGIHGTADCPNLHLRVRGDSRSWQVLYLHRGRRRTVSIGTFPRVPPEEAKKTAREIMQRVAKGEDPAGDKQRRAKCATLADVYSRWLEEDGKPALKPRTLEGYGTLWRLHLQEGLGHRPVEAITGNELSVFFAALRSRLPGASNRAQAFLSVLLNKAVRIGLRTDNPTKAVRKARETARERLLTREEITTIGKDIAAHAGRAMHPASAAIIRLALLTAMRRRELLNLTWPEIDLDAARINLRDSKTGRRSVPLSPQAVAVLRSVPRVKDREQVFLGWMDDQGRDYFDNTLRLDWEALRERTGLDKSGVVFHDLRHAAGSTAAALGLAPTVVQHLLGHSDVSMTQKYLHSTAEQAREVADAIGAALAPALEGGAVVVPVQKDAKAG